MEKKDCIMYYSYDDKRKIFGTAVFVSKRITLRVIDFKPIDKRMCAIKIRVKFKNFSCICAMQQRRKRVKERRNQFYERLERT